MKSSILILLSLFTMLACTKPATDEPTPPATTPSNDLFTAWKLVKYEPGFSPTNNYNGEIQWTFSANNTVHVVVQSGTSVNSTLPLKITGNYTYATSGNQITIANKTYKYVIVGNSLTIEDLVGQAADGKKMTFNKVQ
jgi:hypothetical protein